MALQADSGRPQTPPELSLSPGMGLGLWEEAGEAEIPSRVKY